MSLLGVLGNSACFWGEGIMIGARYACYEMPGATKRKNHVGLYLEPTKYVEHWSFGLF